MSQLDRALGRLAERGDPVGSDLLIARLERQLTSESAPGVVELEARRSVMKTMSPKTEQRTPRWRGSRVAFGAGAAISVVVLAVFAIATLIDSDGPFDSGDALSITDTYFEEFNAGNDENVVALFTPDMSVNWFGEQSRTDFEMITAFFVGEGTILTPPDCTVSEVVVGLSARVSCNFDTLDGITQAVDALPVPTRLAAVVTPDGISQLLFNYGPPDFLHVGDPFNRWISENHPEAIEATAWQNWTTVEEARQTGALQAQFAREWATYLEANGCSYLDGC